MQTDVTAVRIGYALPGLLLLTDGAVYADWLACMLRQAPPSGVVHSACSSGSRDAALQSIVVRLSREDCPGTAAINQRLSAVEAKLDGLIR